MQMVINLAPVSLKNKKVNFYTCPRLTFLKKNATANAYKSISEPLHFKIFWRGMPPEPPSERLRIEFRSSDIWSTRYVFIPSRVLSTILPKCTEESDPEFARAAFSTWSMQTSRPVAFEICGFLESIDQPYPTRGFENSFHHLTYSL